MLPFNNNQIQGVLLRDGVWHEVQPGTFETIEGFVDGYVQYWYMWTRTHSQDALHLSKHLVPSYGVCGFRWNEARK